MIWSITTGLSLCFQLTRHPMSENFSSAAARHWTESHFLSAASHWQEAAYLAGYAAECALKALVGLGGVLGRPLGHDLAALSGSGLEMAVLLNPRLRRLQEPLASATAAGVPLWSETQRYEATGALQDAEYQAMAQSSCELARIVLANLTLDGDWQEVPA